MPFAIDHIVILVSDLDAAVADYTALGFTVTPGGEHSGGASHNALVAFADGSYLELIAFKRAAPEHHWWHHVAAGEGLIDCALLPDDIAALVDTARRHGVNLSGPTPGGRLRPDGQQVSWQLAMPPSADLPFFCADVTPRDLRVPGGAARQHANGVTGIAAVDMAVRDLAASAARYAALFGGAAHAAGAAHGAHGETVSFALGQGRLVLASGAGASPLAAAVRDRLARRGEGIAALLLRGTATALFDPALSHGALLHGGG